MPRASQIVDEAGGADDSSNEHRPPPEKKAKRGDGSMTGAAWAAAHGNAWQKFLEEKLKKCECDNPRVSHSHRAKALKEDEGEGIAPGQPAGCLVCFAPIDRVVRPSPPPCPPLAQAACLLARHGMSLPCPWGWSAPCRAALERRTPSERWMQPRPRPLNS